MRMCIDLNSSLGAPFALVENFGEQQTPSLVLSPKFSTNTKFPPQILELDFNSNATESSLRGRIADSPKQSKQNNLHEVQTESRLIYRFGARFAVDSCNESQSK